MVQSIALTADTRDWFRDASGNLAMVTGAAAVAQNCSTAMRAQRSEMIYAMNTGMPMRATAFDAYNPKQFEAAGRVILAGVAGVLSVKSFVVTSQNNVLSYSAVVKTVAGIIPISGSTA